jgi:hypothetical protein
MQGFFFFGVPPLYIQFHAFLMLCTDQRELERQASKELIKSS